MIILFSNIDDAIAFVCARRKVKHGLEVFKKIMADLGNPQDSYASIHVAGTNGKGSVTWYLKDILEHSGYKCGTFTSPHLIAHQDRIRINGEWIDDGFFLRTLNEYYNIIVDNELSMFEIDMMIACLYFKEQGVDYAIFECGIGGRLDITNVLNHPLSCVIVSIGYDHMDMLGDSLESIAQEKAGIIKPGSKVFIGDMADNLKAIIGLRADNGQVYENDYKVVDDYLLVGDMKIDVCNKVDYQRHNLALALNVIDNIDVKINKDGLSDVLKDSVWAGRFEKVCDDPLVVIDGAHNRQGISALIHEIKKDNDKYVVLFAGLKDKNVNELCNMLKPFVDKLVVTEFDFYRCQRIEDYVGVEEMFKNYEDALRYVMGLNKKVLVCGSLYFISEIRKKFRS